MTKFWCVNFDNDACLKHGIEQNLWLMHYQYAADQSDSGSRKTVITKNWKRLEDIKAGDRFVAYLKSNRFFALGTVIPPRRPKTGQDRTDSIGNYLKTQRSHKSGYVYFTSVVYENFTDAWSHSPSGNKWPVRIDVDKWDSHVPAGVLVKIVNNINLQERQKAVFEITKGDFDNVAAALAAKYRPVPKNKTTQGVAEEDDESVIEALEKSQAKGQGFILDSKLRKALEDYAMAAAKLHFTALGYKCHDHSKNHPYDLLCARGKKVLHVEVKGTQTDGTAVILTPGEVAFARGHKGEMALFLLHSIHVESVGGEFVLSGGEFHLLLPWDVDQGSLKPVSFKYEVPSGVG